MKNFPLAIIIILFIAVTTMSMNINKNSSEIHYVNTADSNTLKSRSSFPFGAAISLKYLNSEPYRNLVIQEFNSITPEGAMKMKTVRPNENTFNFSDGDQIVSFAKKYGLRVHGHTLIWANVPNWVKSYSGDSTAWENIFKTHIQTVVKHFRGQVSSWDVVNEAIEDDGSVKKNIWQKHLGNGYIQRAFVYARLADPNVLLFYNDYGLEYSSKHRDSTIIMIRKMIAMKIPIDGIGLQMHTRFNLGEKKWAAAINAAASTGLKVHISELDISVNPNNDHSMKFTDSIALIQKEAYRTITQLYNKLPRLQKYGITTWGVGDKGTWIRAKKHRPDWPLPFDDYYQPKPAFYGILDGFNAK